MAVTVEWLSWDQLHQSTDPIGRLPPDGTVIVAPEWEGTQRKALQRQIEVTSADGVVVCDKSPSFVPIPDTLPTLLRLIVTVADRNLSVAVSVKSLRTHLNLVSQSKSLFEFAVRLAECTDMALIEHDGPASIPAHFPSLTTPAGPRHSRLGEIIRRIDLPGGSKSSTSLTALKAGLFLVNDFFEESHACSQSIEGMGPHHAGDYWHSILHRREPDYGNSKYWFRHVGRHPIFAELAQVAIRRINVTAGALSDKLENWKFQLVSENRWDPFAFVDLCQAATKDPELGEWCKQLQYDEMLLLLASTYEEMT